MVQKQELSTGKKWFGHIATLIVCAIILTIVVLVLKDVGDWSHRQNYELLKNSH